MKKLQLQAELVAAYDWIDSASEWQEALAAPESYARDAAANALRHWIPAGTKGVNVTTLLGAIAFYKQTLKEKTP